VNQCRHVLSDDEIDRAYSFRFETDRNRWIVARGLLRVVLGRYLYLEPKDVPFRVGRRQKPALACGDEPDLRFNISHSESVALFAVALDYDVGIDIERSRRDYPGESIASLVFSRDEQESLYATAGALRMETFFAYWTCKEAYVKALGAGLSYPMTQFTVRLGSDGSAATVEDNAAGVVAPYRPISLRRLTVGPEHFAAVAMQGAIRRLRCWHGPASVPIGLWRSRPADDCRAA
jgi:4'-phosphopantetheinyl transferase